jgi:branched-chain amino acid transport system substrate-binding protein
MKHRLFGIAAIGASALLAAGCASTSSAGSNSAGPSNAGGGSSASGSAQPVHLAIVYGVTGALAGFAKDFLTGAHAAADSINAAGGVGGRKIDLQILDDQSNPTTAVSVLIKALDSGTAPDAVVPGGESTEVLAMLPLTTSKGIFTVAPGSDPAINDPAKYPDHFGTFASQVQNLVPIGDSLKAKGAKTLGVITSDDAFGDSVVSGIQGVAASAGVKIADIERTDPASLNFDVQYQRLLTHKPDAIFFDFASQDAIGRLLTSRTTLGATNIPVYGGTAAAATPLTTVASAAELKNCSVPVYSFTIARNPEPAYLKPLLAAFKGSKGSILSGGLGWDTVKLVALAVQRSGSRSGATALAGSITGTPVQANYMALFPDGTTYTSTNHFPDPAKGTFGLVSCSATVRDGLWSS